MKILIIGASGFIGRQLLPELLSEGHEVACVSRNPPAAQKILGSGVDIMSWDGRSADRLAEVLEGFDGIVNLTGENLAKGYWTKKRKQSFIDSRAGAGRLLVSAILKLSDKPAWLIQASAMGFYGPQTNGIIDESGLPGTGFLAEMNRQWEESVLPLQEAGIRVVFLRTGIVLGPGGGMLQQLLMPFHFYAGTILGSGRQFLSWIHIQDQVRAIVHLIDNPRSMGPYNLTSPHPVTMSGLIREISRIIRRPAWLKAPAFALRILFGELADEALLASQQVYPAKLLNEGFRYRFPEIGPALENILSKPAR